jgi:hypothetical protein
LRAPRLSEIAEEARIAAASGAGFARGLVRPTLRLGVTGLARAGKTVFITALVHALIHGGRLPLFRPLAEGRIRRAYLEPQPDLAIPRFAYEDHLAALTAPDPVWPQSTRQLAELRLTVEFEPQHLVSRIVGLDRLIVDIVDYPGEWLLDLPLLAMGFEAFARQALAASRAPARARLAEAWHRRTAAADPAAPVDEAAASALAADFAAYLRACRAEPDALSTGPPGRLLMPGDLEGSPALTFAPLEVPAGARPPKGSLWATFERRYEAYKDRVVRPFFRDHFARLDRQIVLVDVLAALNAGPAATADLEAALTGVLAAFRPGRRRLPWRIFAPRIDRILFAATKADHLHRASHDRLQAVLGRLTARAAERAEIAGAGIAALALASVRATREARVMRDGEDLACIVGVPLPGEAMAGAPIGDGEVAVFPGELPEEPDQALAGAAVGIFEAFRAVRFRPGAVEAGPDGAPVLPHIRLDRALDFLLADRLR